MEIISITNNKGGVGKTTTALNIAVGLSKYPYKKRVLVIDLEGQGNASSMLGWKLSNEKEGYPTIFTSLSKNPDNNERGIDVYESCYDNIYLCPASPMLYEVDGFINSFGLDLITLREWLTKPVVFRDNRNMKLEEAFDFVIIDCPPAMNKLTKNAIAASNSLIIPIELENYSVDGIGGILVQFVTIKRRFNPNLTIKGIVSVRENPRRVLSREMNAQLEKEIGQYMTHTHIPMCETLKIEQAKGNIVLDSKPYCAVSLAYSQLIKELFSNNA